MRRLFILLSAAALTVSAMVLPVSAVTYPHTTGTWSSYPPQTSTTTTTTTTGTAYQSAVRPPINADGSSNFSGKKGVIPVQFDLQAAPTTTVTTTTMYDPPVWQSIGTDTNTSNDASYAALVLQPKLTFSQISNLSATYTFTDGDCFGGSLRWDLFGAALPGGHIYVYYGDPSNTAPSFQSCSGAYDQSGKNLMDTSDASLPNSRFEIASDPGHYISYADVVAAFGGGDPLVGRVQLTLDSGWHADQGADISDVTVNDNTWVPLTSDSSSVTTTGYFASTCTLPQAELRWAKNDPSATGGVNEASSIQPSDTGQFYRQVDCKYIYNLDVSSLSGVGTYTVWVRINSQNIQVPASFDLK